MTEVESN